ncbi:MAG: branched-chain amino acid transporter AzlD [Erysipelotrichia bacterium]|nr:branched-chain amino acid transporter AzlD [Erysipelotrichia bacterium]
MKMNNYFPLLQIITISLVTMLVRFSPFLIFNKQEKLPDIISYLGKVLPTAIMAMLVVYCLKDVNITIFPYGLKELIAVLVVAMLHIYKRNTLLSIVCGTICYMLLIQLF